MEKKEIFNQFDLIEQKVEELIRDRNLLEAENTKLKDRNSELELELQGKKEAEKQYSEEKDFVKSKIDSLLARLDLNAEN